MSEYVNITPENVDSEHLCCAIGDKKHRAGVAVKQEWLTNRLSEGHVFRKLNERGKVFIEYAPLETAWVPVTGDNYLYIYCLWVAGKFKSRGHARALLEYCLADARRQQRAGVCILSAKKKKPFLADKQFLQQFGFETVDTLSGDHELLALSFDGTQPQFCESARAQRIAEPELTIYYGRQCPYIPNCLTQVREYCAAQDIPLRLIAVETLAAAKALPGLFNNWAVFYNGRFETVHLLNEGQLKKLLARA